MKKKNTNKKKIYTTILSNVFIWLMIVLVAVSIANNFSPFEKIKEVSYTEYQNYLNEGLIESAEIVDPGEKVRLVSLTK